ncbi:hypothetical protein ACEWY4_007797 [Coilia grayii]|uniref:Reverse transcriptase domain-containing protein n=1 Tax=Coilia grayii TaxID=363190 RepID=A0ABD1K983_9TELE
MFLVETWLKEEGAATLIETCPPNYKFYQSIRDNKRGGGIAVIFSDKLSCNEKNVGTFTSFEYLAIKVKTDHSLLLITLYRPPKSSPTFLSDFSTLVSAVLTNYDRIIITGDFNIHVNKSGDSNGKDLLNTLDGFGLHQYVTEATHQLGNTLDLVISQPANINNISVSDIAISDHYCVLFEFPFTIHSNRETGATHKRCINESAQQKITELISSRDLLNGHKSLDEMVAGFNSNLKEILDEVAPLKTKHSSRVKTSPWMNESVREKKRQCRAAERAWRKSKLEVNRIILKEHIITYNNTIRTERKNYLSKIITDHHNNTRVLFSTIEKVLNPAPVCDMLSLATTPKCEEFAEFFTNKILAIRAEIIRDPNYLQDAPIKEPPTLQTFSAITEDDLYKLIKHSKRSTCSLDPIPTFLMKNNFNYISTPLLQIINTSILTGIFPSAFKTAVVKPLLKKPNLDYNTLNNYRPISNLPFISKILEKAVFLQLNQFLNENDILEKFQSGFRANHSTETALTKIVNDLRLSTATNKVSALVLLDLSAAFDTIDHNILLHRLKTWVGLSGHVLKWLESYITGRQFYISLGDHISKNHDVPFGVAQGSCLGPLLFSLYMLPLGNIIKKHNIDFHSYADDTQLYISVEPNKTTALQSLTSCLSAVTHWMSNNFLKLNENKTELLLIGPKDKREALLPSLGNLNQYVREQVTSLGVILDSDLSLKPHINKVTKTAYFHLRNIAKVRPFLTKPDAEKLVHAFITSRLDYCNALFTGLPKKSIEKLQLIQNSAARLLTKTRKMEHITPVLAELHWLPVYYRIDFKVLLLVFKAVNGLAPCYIADALSSYTPARALRSADAGLLRIPDAPPKRIGESAFSYYAPKRWNALPQQIREAESIDIFKRQLKTYLFNQAYT